ncbi:hypothetical protein EJ03DRAFT_112940 [Teratosphaeria nubilosa]|uniref:Uncharacterized protein n=1 Tax=Teratosphaeria nubilosa TaxID=161662 RepID=A0A6G1L8W0_9PEZI|nr:hypothetical protein EJ03DRAFT_112940 [Teratosphaeria nubilosa]
MRFRKEFYYASVPDFSPHMTLTQQALVGKVHVSMYNDHQTRCVDIKIFFCPGRHRRNRPRRSKEQASRPYYHLLSSRNRHKSNNTGIPHLDIRPQSAPVHDWRHERSRGSSRVGRMERPTACRTKASYFYFLSPKRRKTGERKGRERVHTAIVVSHHHHHRNPVQSSPVQSSPRLPPRIFPTDTRDARHLAQKESQTTVWFQESS